MEHFSYSCTHWARKTNKVFCNTSGKSGQARVRTHRGTGSQGIVPGPALLGTTKSGCCLSDSIRSEDQVNHLHEELLKEFQDFALNRSHGTNPSWSESPSASTKK